MPDLISDYGDLLDALAILKKIRMRILKEVSSGEKDLSVTDITVFSKVCKGESRMTMSEISDVTALSNAIITSSVDNLETKGLVTREKGEDRRTYHIVATSKGMEKFRRIKIAQDKAIGNIFGSMSDEDQRKLASILSQLKELLGRFL